MRTRRSVRNQEILFKALFKSQPEAHPELVPAKTCFGCANYPKGGRDYQHCTLHGVRVRGATTDRECYRKRGTPLLP